MNEIVEIELIKEIVGKDELLQETQSIIKNKIIATKKSVTYREFYIAKNSNFNPIYIFEIYPFEYEQENKLSYEEQEYKVIRTFLNSNGKLELTCELNET